MNTISSITFRIYRVTCYSHVCSVPFSYLYYIFVGRDIFLHFTNQTSILSIFLAKFPFKILLFCGKRRICQEQQYPCEASDPISPPASSFEPFTSVKLKCSVTLDFQVGLEMSFNIGTRVYNCVLAMKNQ